MSTIIGFSNYFSVDLSCINALSSPISKKVEIILGQSSHRLLIANKHQLTILLLSWYKIVTSYLKRGKSTVFYDTVQSELTKESAYSLIEVSTDFSPSRIVVGLTSAYSSRGMERTCLFLMILRLGNIIKNYINNSIPSSFIISMQ